MQSVLTGADDSVLTAVAAEAAALTQRGEAARKERTELAERKQRLAAGAGNYNRDTVLALDRIREKYPEAGVQVLCDLVDLDSDWQAAIEGSSRIFWGMSKVLDKRQGLVAALLGIDECPFPESPIQLQVHLPPAGYRGVLFIENLMSFEQAVRSTSGAFEGLALVYASGFKSSAQRLRSGLCKPVKLARLEQWPGASASSHLVREGPL